MFSIAGPTTGAGIENIEIICLLKPFFIILTT